MKPKQYLRQHPFARHVLTLMTGTAFAQAIPLLISPLLTRLYTPAEFGLLALYTAAVNALLAIACLRYDLTIVMARTNEEARQLMQLSSRISWASAVLFSLLLLLLAKPISQLLHSPSLRFWLLLVGANVLLLAQIQILTFWFNRQQQYRTISQNRVQQSLATAGTQTGLGFIPAMGMTGLVLGTLIGQMLAWWHLVRTWRQRHPEPTTLTCPQAHSLAYQYRNMPLLNGPNAVIDAVRLNGINFMLAHLFNNALLGQFSLAWRMVQAPISLVNGALSQVFFQKIATTAPQQLYPLLLRTIIRLALLGAAPFALVYVLAPSLFPIVFGQEWRLAGDIAQALTPWLFLNFITSPLANFFLVGQQQRILLLFSILYMLTPLSIIYLYHHDILHTLRWVSYSMSLLLAGLIIMVLVLSKRQASL